MTSEVIKQLIEARRLADEARKLLYPLRESLNEGERFFYDEAFHGLMEAHNNLAILQPTLTAPVA